MSRLRSDRSLRGRVSGFANVASVPNMISAVRILLAFILAYLLIFHEVVLASGWLIVIIGMTDWLDGYIARTFGQVTALGESLDPIADRLAIVAGAVGGVVVGVVPPWFAAVILARDIFNAVLVSLVRWNLGRTLRVRFGGKVATLLLYFAAIAVFIGAGAGLDRLNAAGRFAGLLGAGAYVGVMYGYTSDARHLLRRGARAF